MSSDFFCPRCRHIHSYRISFCPDNAREPTQEEIEENTQHMAWADNKEIDRLAARIQYIKGQGHNIVKWISPGNGECSCGWSGAISDSEPHKEAVIAGRVPKDTHWR